MAHPIEGWGLATVPTVATVDRRQAGDPWEGLALPR